MSYVFLDSNINILNLHSPDIANYLNCIFSKGYLQIIQKATRLHNDAKSLIDHILCNSGDLEICTGTLISDLSDHFFTFVLPHIAPPPKQLHRTITGRDFSNTNMLEFKRQLNVVNWNSVISKDDVDEAYDEFWTVYTGLFDQSFPLKKRRFNKNVHKMQSFMTNGLLVSRNNKKILHKTSIAFPTAENVAKYKNFKTVYQRVLRAAKKLYFKSKLEQNANNPKKTWDTLNEILGKTKKSESVEKICRTMLLFLILSILLTVLTNFLLRWGSKFRTTWPLCLNNLKITLITAVKSRICCSKIPPLST
jgi:hypothetical protein